MAKKVSQLLVIDASVANAAGGEEATHPTAKHCRDFLLAVLDICHRVVMTPDIRDEWTKHESNFARTWRRQMVAKKKLEYRADIQTNEELWKQIEGTAGLDSEREAMFKDFHLIEAALATDKTVISLDERVRRLFGQAAGLVPEIRDIVWVNPDRPEEEPIEWLRAGGIAESERRLGC
ncbi:hypothetical protein [Kamptonema formosum]|uniref:hypothetical protein n=1 Tax=Kamptonema formosum TaxID=331992 RepID=UPI000376AFC9|nr:hypothetical protein [Oscillatoria sp. PCC 10802]